MYVEAGQVATHVFVIGSRYADDEQLVTHVLVAESRKGVLPPHVAKHVDPAPEL